MKRHFIFFIPTGLPPRRVKRAACEPRPSHLQLFLYFSLYTLQLTFLLHSRSQLLLSHWGLTSSLGFALEAFIAEVWGLLVRLASFRPVSSLSFRLCRRSRWLNLTPTRRGLPVSVPGCRARFFLSPWPAWFCQLLLLRTAALTSSDVVMRLPRSIFPRSPSACSYSSTL